MLICFCLERFVCSIKFKKKNKNHRNKFHNKINIILL